MFRFQCVFDQLLYKIDLSDKLNGDTDEYHQ